MKEKAVVFGRKKALVGVLTQPERTSAVDNYPAMILLNAGLVHRVGPNRIYVQIARRLAASGFPTLRFDLSGIGDSVNRTDDLSLIDGIVSDTKEAMDLLTREVGARQFILMGICSGADNSLRVAKSDARVIGAVPIEPYYFGNAGYYFYFYSRRLFDVKSWRRLVTMKSDFWRIIRNYTSRRDRSAATGGGQSVQARAAGRKALESQIVSETQQLLDRGVSLHFVYCVDSPSYYNHYLALQHKAAETKQLHTTVFANTDHTFTLLASQTSLVNSIHDWVKALVKAPSLRPEVPGSASPLTAAKSL